MTDDLPVGIEAEDAVVLHGTPGHAIITLTDRSHRSADADVLGRKPPGGKLGFMLWQQQESAFQAAYPEIVLIILKQRPHIRRVQIERATDVIISL